VPGQRKTRGDVTQGSRSRDVNSPEHLTRTQESACDTASMDGPAESQSQKARRAGMLTSLGGKVRRYANLWKQRKPVNTVSYYYDQARQLRLD